MKLSNHHTTWQKELEKEAPPEAIIPILNKIYPGAKINDQRHHHESIDWIVNAVIDDKTDNWLGYTGKSGRNNITLDEKTIKRNIDNLLLLYVNPAFPGYYILIEKSLLDIDKIEKTAHTITRTTEQETGSYQTRCFVVPIEQIKPAILETFPNIIWWCLSRRKPEVG